MKVLAPATQKIAYDTVRRWNAPLRAEVRAVTALKLAKESGRTVDNIPVDVTETLQTERSTTKNSRRSLS
jgi:hypothetical protein